jgi:hypothetical protein
MVALPRTTPLPAYCSGAPFAALADGNLDAVLPRQQEVVPLDCNPRTYGPHTWVSGLVQLVPKVWALVTLKSAVGGIFLVPHLSNGINYVDTLAQEVIDVL